MDGGFDPTSAMWASVPVWERTWLFRVLPRALTWRRQWVTIRHGWIDVCRGTTEQPHASHALAPGTRVDVFDVGRGATEVTVTIPIRHGDVYAVAGPPLRFRVSTATQGAHFRTLTLAVSSTDIMWGFSWRSGVVG